MNLAAAKERAERIMCEGDDRRAKERNEMPEENAVIRRLVRPPDESTSRPDRYLIADELLSVVTMADSAIADVQELKRKAARALSKMIKE